MRSRLFNQTKQRNVVSLNGTWRFHFPDDHGSLEPLYLDSERGVVVDSPGVWEQLSDRISYRGKAVAQRNFETLQAGPARLVFKGVSHTCWVFLDDREIGYHHNAYTPFSIDIANLPAGRHDLRLLITNEHGDESSVHLSNDYYNYGGISRPVELHLLQRPCFIAGLQLAPMRGLAGWELEGVIRVMNLDAECGNQTLAVECVGARVELRNVTLRPGLNCVAFSLSCPDAMAWEPGTPQLYLAEATLADDGEVYDDWRDRLGFRTVAIYGSTLLLNDQPVFMLGMNRHEDHPSYGCALPVAQMREDLRLCVEMGCNAIRTSHYPNDERFLDLCDELGLMVWEENHARGLFYSGSEGDGVVSAVREPMRHPRFREQCRLINEEMVVEHYNHPSILVWGVLNECDSFSEYGRSCYREQIDQVRALDSSRPVTYASCHPRIDRCQDLPDICSWNIYPGWYRDDSAATVLARLLKDHGDEIGGKPLIISEFGAGALPGFHDPVRCGKWSEERQAMILEDCLSTLVGHPRLCGLFVWQFCDVRVDEGWAMRRPRTMNNKGVVDEFRRPKLAMKTVARHFQNWQPAPVPVNRESVAE